MKKKFFFILFLIFIISNIGLGSWGLTESSEARYAEISKEMVQTGDYLHPVLLGIKHYDKPPLTYYITSLGYKIFGINEFGARFFLIVALILQLLLVFYISLALFNKEKTAIASAIIYFSFPIVLIATHNLTTDAYLTTLILMATYSWLLRKKDGFVFYLYTFYILLGLAFLTKGPVVFIPIIVFIGVWKIINKEKIKISIHTILGTLLFIIISASWYVFIIMDNPFLWDYFIQKELLGRIVNAENFHRAQPFWYYILLAPLIGLPWFIFILVEIINKFKSIKKDKSRLFILTLTILVLFFVFSIFSSKLTLYILPIYPFIAILGGSLLFKIPKKRLQYYILSFKIIIPFCMVGLLISLFFYNFEWGILSFYFLIIFMALIIGYIYTYSHFRPVKKLTAFSLLFAFCTMLSFYWLASHNEDEINSAKNVIGFITSEKGESFNNVMVYNYLLPSASFYLDKEIITINNGKNTTTRNTQLENDDDYKRTFVDIKMPNGIIELKALIQQKDNVLLVRKKDSIPDSLQFIIKPFHQKHQVGKWVIYL